MKEIRILSSGWYIKDYELPAEPGEDALAAVMSEEPDGSWLPADMPNTAQEVLWAHDRLDKTVLETGSDMEKKCAWVAERDWAFRTSFSRPLRPGRVFLEFDGIDAVAHIALNGKIVCYHRSMYIKSRVDVSEYLQDENELLIYVHSPYKMIDAYKELLPERYAGKISARALLRKSPEDFSPYAGFVPYFTPIGLYDDVRLVVSECEMEYIDVGVRFNRNNTRADISVRMECPAMPDVTAEVSLESPDGSPAASARSAEWRLTGEKMEATLHLSVRNPELWWPRNYGKQPLYRLKASIAGNGSLLDEQIKTLGIRHIEMAGDMKFRVNGKIVKLWGADVTPMWGPSHRWIPERGKTLLDYAEQAHMNILRMWGPSQPYHDEFYEEADRRGFLLWQDFFTGGAYMPDLPEYVGLITREAEQQVKRLKHHASILLWCGGNEQIYTSDLAHPDETDRIGHDILYYGFKNLCMKMDPGRYYHTSCPSGGEYANQASFGDNHGSRASRSFLPGEAYATFFTEDIRTTVPEIGSLRRFIPPEGLWPEGYRDIANYHKLDQLPPAWVARTRPPRSYEKSGPHEQYFDAADAQSLVYKVNEAAAHDMRLIMNASRRGKPYHMSWDERKTQGHMVWKFNTAWPQAYCACIDYYLEPGRVFYALRRAFSPVHISIDMQEWIFIWGANDTPEHVTGQVDVQIYDIRLETMFRSITFPAAVLAGESTILKNISDIGQFPLNCVIRALLRDQDGNVLSSDFQLIRPERRYKFPEARLSIADNHDGSITVSSDGYARCVELSGNHDGDEFGWRFEDNYFDMMPGDTRSIKLLGRHRAGEITAKAHYSPHISKIIMSP